MPERSDIFMDSVTLSNFALAESFDLIVGRYGRRAVIPAEVLNEIFAGMQTGFSSLRTIVIAVKGKKISHRNMSLKERLAYAELLGNLGSGEASCIACAQLNGGTVATDDRAARECCRDRGVPVTGTLGTLLAVCNDHHIGPDAADEILSRMIANGFYSPVVRISDLV